MRRRELLEAMAVALVAAPSACAKNEAKRMSESNRARKLPVLFVAHGAPILMDDPGWVGELAALGTAVGKPKAVLMLSAHWEQRPITLGATRTVPLYYDFYGFPERYYEVTYPAPGAPDLAAEV